MSESSLAQNVANIEAGDTVVACAFLGRTPVYALADGALLLAEIGEEKRVKAHEDGAILVALSDGKRIFTAGDDGLLVATDAEGRSETIADEKGKWIDALTLREDGAMAWSAGKQVRARDAKGEIKTFDAPSAVPPFTPERVTADLYNPDIFVEIQQPLLSLTQNETAGLFSEDVW